MSATRLISAQELQTLYSGEHAWLHAWLRRKLGCAHHAADVAHDTFLRIIGSRDLLLGLREPRAFLVTTAKRLIIDQARRQRIEQAYLAELAAQAADGAAAAYPAPEETLAALQALEQISAALDGVTKRAREAFVMHYLDGATLPHIATHFGVSTKMVQKYLIQALTSCHRALGEDAPS